MNTYRLSITACAFLVLALCVPFADAQSTSLDIEAGYQEVDVNGNEDMFRTQINQQNGFVLRNFSINYVDPTGDAGFVDRLRVDASGFGGNPAGRFRLQMGLGDIYRINLFYQQFETFSALPAYANPLLDDGVYPGQHTWERNRDILDFQLEILPGRTITPIVGYRWNSYDGPGGSTYSVGADDFQVNSQLEETEQEFYLGVNFATKSIQGTLLQGWRNFDGTYTDTLAPGAGAGNNPGTVIGQEVELDSFNRTTTTDADTPVTTFHMTGRVTETSRFVASYARADYEGDTNMNETLSGSLVSFQLSRFFQGLDQSVQSRTENPYWRGEARFEWDISQKVGMRVGYEMRDRQLQGWALISSLYMDTMTFNGFDPKDIETLVDAQTGYEREEGIANIRFDFRNLGAFSLWAEYAITDQDVDLSADVAEIILPGGQEGEYDRQISSFDLGAMVTVGNFKFLVDAVGQNADEVIVRTDFNDRLRLRGRIDWSISRMFRRPAHRRVDRRRQRQLGDRLPVRHRPLRRRLQLHTDRELPAAGGLGQLPDRHRDADPGAADLPDHPLDVRRRGRAPRGQHAVEDRAVHHRSGLLDFRKCRQLPIRDGPRLCQARHRSQQAFLDCRRVRELGLQRRHVPGGQLRRQPLGLLRSLAAVTQPTTLIQGASRPPFLFRISNFEFRICTRATHCSEQWVGGQIRNPKFEIRNRRCYPPPPMADENLTQGRIFRFWLPLAATWLMMAVEGPFLAAVIARLAEPIYNLAAYGVAYSLALVVEAPVIMLMSAATALARNRASYLRLLEFHPHHQCDGHAGDARHAPAAGVRPVGHRSHRAPAGGRIPHPRRAPDSSAVAGRHRHSPLLPRGSHPPRAHQAGRLRDRRASRRPCLVPQFVLARFTDIEGAWVGAAALTMGVSCEAVISRLMAAGSIRSLLERPGEATGAASSYTALSRFYYPLALTTLLSLGIHPVVTFFVGNSRASLESLAVLPVVSALVFVFRSLGLAYQEVVIALMGDERRGLPILTSLRTRTERGGGLRAGADRLDTAVARSGFAPSPV